MKTDIPLKRITQLFPADIVAWINNGDVPAYAKAETIELPASKTSLDTIVRIQRSDGSEYLHLIEWQGYSDSHFLWRLMGYAAWLGNNHAERPILVTAVYLKPDDEPRETLNQVGAGWGGWSLEFHTIRLWEQKAYDTLATNAPGLITLSPLMQGADAPLVEQAVRVIMQTTEQPMRGELLTALGTFAERLIPSKQFINLVHKEQLMPNGLIRTLFEEEFSAIEFEKDLLSQEKDLLIESLQQSIFQLLQIRYTDVSHHLIESITRVRDAHQLRQLLDVVISSTRIEDIQQVLETMQTTG